MVRRQGRIRNWKDDRGFGFIEPNEGGDDVFVHIREISGLAGRPVGGERVTFQVVQDGNGRRRAVYVNVIPDMPPRCIHESPAVRTPVSASGSFLITIALLFLGFLLVLGLQNRIPIVFVAFYAFISLVAFVVYAADKAAARQGAWRTKESTLHLLALFCGWPGALIAQQVFRHKTKKEDFVFIFWVTVVANCALLAVLVSPAGRSLYASTVP